MAEEESKGGGGGAGGAVLMDGKYVLPPAPTGLVRQRSRSASPPRRRDGGGKVEERYGDAPAGYWSDGDGGKDGNDMDSIDDDYGSDEFEAFVPEVTPGGGSATASSGAKPPPKSNKRKGKAKAKERVGVFCRVRPANEDEQKLGEPCVTFAAEGNGIYLEREGVTHNFQFQRVFPQEVRQDGIYHFTGKPLVDTVMQGYNAALICYGQTGSGKTYTMMGPPHPRRKHTLMLEGESRGLVPRMMDDLFERLGMLEAPGVQVDVRCKFVEIYMEKIRDLFMPAKHNLRLRRDVLTGRSEIPAATVVPVRGVDGMLELMTEGTRNRAVGTTKANKHSSRSHSIFIVSVAITDDNAGYTQEAELYLVDLAGSEKVQKTGASGVRLQEARRINGSLLALGQVIAALTARPRRKHIPYRNSTLTSLLRNSFGGNSKTTLIVNISPSSYNCAESLSTLRFGDRANHIRNAPTQNQKPSVEQLKRMIELANATLYGQNMDIINLERLVANMATTAETMLLKLHPDAIRDLSRAHPIVRRLGLRVFERFPPVLLKYLFQFLDGFTLGRARLVCSLWDHIGKQEFLWLAICRRQFGTEKERPEEFESYQDWYTHDAKERAQRRRDAKIASLEDKRRNASIGVRVVT